MLRKPDLINAEEESAEILHVKDPNFLGKSMYHIMVKTLAPKKGPHEDVEDVMRNLLVQISNFLCFDVEDFFLRIMMHAAQEALVLKPYASWIMHFIMKHTA